MPRSINFYCKYQNGRTIKTKSFKQNHPLGSKSSIKRNKAAIVGDSTCACMYLTKEFNLQ